MALARDHYTLEEYFQLDEASELPIEYEDGHLYAMSGETGEHNDVVTNIIMALTAQARANNCRIRHQGIRLQVTSKKYYYPDVMVLCGPRSNDPHIEHDPCLVIEALSPSTAYRDRGQKLNAYLRLSSLEKYILISPTVMQVGVYSRGSQGWLYEVFEAESDQIEIPCIETHLSLERIYQSIPIQP